MGEVVCSLVNTTLCLAKGFAADADYSHRSPSHDDHSAATS